MITTLDLCDDLEIPWERVTDWHGPIWTGERFIFEDDRTYGDVAYFHELCHWFVADEWQLECPDFGLGKNNNGYGLWGSSKWPMPDDEFSRSRVFLDDVGTHLSWSIEDRVLRGDAAEQEALAVYAMALYAVLNPDQHEDVDCVMDDFGAWQPPNRHDPFPWTTERNHEIVDLIAPCLDIDPILAFEKMEYSRMLGADNE